MGLAPDGHDYLPRVEETPGVWVDVVRQTSRWHEIASTTALNVGSGRRFIVEYDAQGRGRIRLLTDVLGTCQGFRIP